MPRRLLMSVLAAMVSLAGLLAPGTASAANTANTASTASPAAYCTGGVTVIQFTFTPPVVQPTATSSLLLELYNCGTQPVTGSTIWYGQYAGQNCPVLDPGPAYPFTIAVGATYELSNTYGNPGGGCQPTSLRMSVNVNVNGIIGTVDTASATLKFTPPCTGNGIVVDSFSFSPASVVPTANSSLILVLQNCTGQAVTGQTEWSAQLTGSGTGTPPGCPLLNPDEFEYAMAPDGLSTTGRGYTAPPASCLATGLHVTANVYDSYLPGIKATAGADLVITPPPPSVCHVTFTPTYWSGGFTANVTITNTSSSAINGWSLTFGFPGDQKITNAWNATVTQSGASVKAVNLGYNASIAPGGSQSFGVQGTWGTGNVSPTVFAVNEAICS